MPNDTKHNGRVSDTTSNSNEPRLSETEFLQQQAVAAREAFDATLLQMRASLKDAGDVRAWAERYPWATVGAATAAGFLVATALVPRRRSVDEEPQLLERILADKKIAARVTRLSQETENTQSRASMFQSIGMTLLKTFGPAIQSAVAAALAAKAAAPDEQELAEAARTAENTQAET